jgi:hypothetical protein
VRAHIWVANPRWLVSSATTARTGIGRHNGVVKTANERSPQPRKRLQVRGELWSFAWRTCCATLAQKVPTGKEFRPPCNR